MNFSVWLIHPLGAGIPDSVQQTYERRARQLGARFRWRRWGQALVLSCGTDAVLEANVAVDGAWAAFGSVRLDNRKEVERWLGLRACSLNDLELVLRTIACFGVGHVQRLIGDFGFVVWNAHRRSGIAAVDAFALKKLYWTDHTGCLAFSSRAEALALDDQYDEQYLAELVALCSPTPTLTPYTRVRSVSAGTFIRLEGWRVDPQRYWSPMDFEPLPYWSTSAYEAVSTCRDLLIKAVQSRVGENGETWAQLSGGTDSSTVVSVSQWLAQRGLGGGLAGTVTYADRDGSAADERQYSSAVAERWKVPNETIVDPPFWLEEGSSPPRTDFPCFTLPFYPRERRLCDIVCRRGGRVLLTGTGGDELFTGTMLFFADWVAQGRLLPAAREIMKRAVVGRVSFWHLAYLNAVLPLLPGSFRNRVLGGQATMPRWLSPTLVRRHGLHERTFPALSYGGRWGHKYHDAIAAHVIGLGTVLDIGTVIPDVLDVRHPFLYRPLVEFALQLPPELLVRPNARKWVLREAMRGILPESVRTRIGKGSPAELYASSLSSRRAVLEPLVERPILSDLGIVDERALRTAFDDAPRRPHSKEHWPAVLQFTLAVEAWLQMRSGRWPREDRRWSSKSTINQRPSI